MSPTAKSPLDSWADEAPAFVVDPGTMAFASAAPITSAAAAAPAMALYLTEPGNVAAISYTDINQGQIGDCFLLSSIGELAIFHPADISGMIHANANGTETVTLYEAANGHLPTYGTTAYKPVQVTVANVFPTYAVNNGATQDVVNNTKEIWVQVLEKAVATLGGGYGAIANGGNPMIAMEELTGHAATNIAPASATAATLSTLSKAGDLLVFDTANSGALPYNLVGNHAYMFEGLTTVNNVAMVQLANPWGTHEPAAIPVAQLSKVFVEIDIGHG